MTVTSWGPAAVSTAVTGAQIVGDRLVTTTRFGPIVVAETPLGSLWGSGSRGPGLRVTTLPDERGRGAWGLSVADGVAWVGSYAPGHLTGVDLATGSIVGGTAEPPDQFFWGLGRWQGCILGGTYSRGAVAGLDLATGEAVDLGSPAPGAAYVRGVAALGDDLYACVASPASLHRLRPGGAFTDVTPARLRTESAALLVAAGEGLVAVGTDPNGLIGLVAPDGAERIVETGERSVDAFAFGEGVLYAGTRPAGRIVRIGLDDGRHAALGQPVVGAETRALAVRGEELWGVTGTGIVWRADAGTGAVTGMVSLLELGHPVLAEPVQSILYAHGRVHVAGHFRVSLHDPEVPGRVVVVDVPGEPKRMIAMGEWVVMAMYPSTEIWRYRTADPAGSLECIGRIGNSQTRPLALAAWGDDLLVGTQPDLGEHGGALTWISGGHVHSYRNIVDQQTIRAVAVAPDGRCFLGSDLAGGLGSTPYEGQPVVAQVDPETGRLGWSVSLRSSCRSLVWHEGRLVASSAGGELSAIDADTGHVLAEAQGSPTAQLALWQRPDGDALLAVDLTRITRLSPSLTPAQEIVAFDAPARWYTEPQVACDERGRLWTLREQELVRVG